MILLCLGTARGQELAEWLKDANVPPPPAEMVTDEGGLFNSRPESLQKMRQAVQKLAQERGYKIYVVVKSVMIGNTASQLAGQMQQAWVPNGDGLVLVYESNSQSLGLGRGYEEDVTAPDQRWLIPSHEIMRILARVMKQVGSKPAPADYMEQVTLSLAQECSAHFAKLDAPAPGGRLVRLAVLALGATALLVLIVMGLGLLLRRSGNSKTQTFTFPQTDVPTRLKAPFGGGKVIVRRFGAASK